jgi:hypothetical protein
MTMAAEEAECEIHFYGERGLVNGLFLDLRESGRTVEFLRKIEFAYRSERHIDLPGATDIVVIVEAGFAEFGWPDAILVARTPDQSRMVFFVEAKAGLYRDEAQDYAQRDAGFNSTINGQFTLRYRLANALRTFQGGQTRLVEPTALATAYGEPNPRRLSKPGNLRHIVQPHLLGASGYFFVALTDDAANMWQEIETQQPRLLPYLAELAPEGAMASATAWQVEHNTWPAYRENFGWIGFRDIEPLVAEGRFFRHARQFLDAKRRNVPIGEPGRGPYRNLRTKPWDSFSDRTIRLRDRLRAVIRESDAGQGRTAHLRRRERQ